MDVHKTYRLANIFFKAAQALPDSAESGTSITQVDKDNFKKHAETVTKSAKIVNDWVMKNISPVSNDQRDLELKRFSGHLFDAAKNLQISVDQFIADESTNKTINNVKPKMQVVVQNYNAIRPAYIPEAWISKYIASDEAKAINQIRDSIKFMESFVTKQTNEEANQGSSPPVP